MAKNKKTYLFQEQLRLEAILTVHNLQTPKIQALIELKAIHEKKDSVFK